jgi:hypothetical protein
MTSNDYSKEHVTPAKAGVQNGHPLLDPGFCPEGNALGVRRDDASTLVVLQVLVEKWNYLMSTA